LFQFIGKKKQFQLGVSEKKEKKNNLPGFFFPDVLDACKQKKL